ncbi:DUF934 domain-containing protein [Pseudopelagicola sp. nBUS_20]|uniref:DUF934 domain-containing protein n=1 Tax=Pseudopelagicola sp. nBUS_20 TaxID=3395317 RepID=UPI003EBE38C0
MSVIVNDDGFKSDDWTLGFAPSNEAANDVLALDVTPDTNPATLTKKLRTAKIIRIDFPNFADGRGFTIARQIRLAGYTGRLRAKGHIISDQYAMARRCGFDEIEISNKLAERQPEEEWLFRSNWQAHDYQARLRGAL